jgi:hypothetical protein
VGAIEFIDQIEKTREMRRNTKAAEECAQFVEDVRVCLCFLAAWLSLGALASQRAMTIRKTFITVTIAALAGLVMGGVFGLAAGKMTPDFFRHVIPWQDVEPVGFAIFGGATVGVLLGGGLGCFGVLIQFILEVRRKP